MEASTRKTRYVFIRHLDYWWEHYNLILDAQGKPIGPACAEFSVYNEPKPVRDAASFFHFDFYNLKCLSYELLHNEAFRTGAEWARFKQRGEAFLRGRKDYFISYLYYPGEPLGNDFCAYLPQNTTLLSCAPDIMMNGKKPYYATIFLQESRFLTPPVICEWLEKLSPVLFGDNTQYEFGHFPDENQTKESYESYR